ncbi:hypothetical protein evm_011076 [Chilo suppressalis]|nr:hypothetical protein evm_011076 [Chilo suppressalis]
MSLVRKFVLLTTEHFFNIYNLDYNERAEEALTDFVHHSQTLLLQSFISDNALVLHTKMQFDQKKSIIFYKSNALELNSENSMEYINLITVTNKVAESLYQIVKQIYSPLLANDYGLVSHNIQKNLSDLETNLRIITHGKANENINVILTIEDEVEYWKGISEKKNTSKKERDNALAYYELFEDICEELRSMQANNIFEIRESTENIGGILDDIWRLTAVAYSEDRMMHIINIIGHSICTIIQKSISSSDLWNVQDDSKENMVLLLLADSLGVIKTWISASKSLTETYWPNYALHTWSGKPYIPLFCLNFENRLKEVYEIRSTYSQLNKLLTINEREELKIRDLFEPFKNINIWIYNGPNQVWKAAVSCFSTNLRPAETKIAEKLRPRLHNTSTKQMLYEFMRYKALINRPIVKRELNNELEVFISSLISLLKSIKSQLDSDEIDVQMYQPPEMSPVVQQVQWAKHMEGKVQDIRTCAEKYLADFDGSIELIKSADQLLQELTAMYTQLHDDWSRELLALVNSGSLQLRLERPVVEFSGTSKMLEVQYEARAVRCEREARALKALGLPPPPAVAAALQALTDALAHAQRLQQVASFHNTLSERMVPSARPMMLQGALQLSALVQNHQPVYWHDAAQLAAYVDRLVGAVGHLDAQNTYLTKQHIAIRVIVEKLLDTELLTQQAEWKKHVKDIRDIIEMVEANGYKNTDSWRLHWDYQLYKVLECQYIKSLLSLHKHFPHVKVDLVFRGLRVSVSPALEQVRAQQYAQLRRLLALPAHAPTLHARDHDRALYLSIVHEHSWLGNKAVQQLESALSALERTCDTWTRRAALSCVDIESLCSEHLKEPADWEANFKACKAYGQAVAKMTFEDEKIEWITVGTVSLRREFEAQTRNLWACLMTSLQNSCRADALEVDAFIASASVMLENKSLPKNAKDLAEISAKQQTLQKNMPEMEKTVENLKRKSHMLRTWGGDSTTEGVIKEWQKIRDMMLGQQQMFEHQADIVKSTLSGEWDNLNSSVEAWASRWSQNKGRLEETHGVLFPEMADRCRSVFDAQAQWEKFVVDRDELVKECVKFNLDLQPSDVWTEAEKLMDEYTNIWTPLKNYNEEYESICGQDWLLFQKKLHLLDEFVSKWTANLEPFTAVTLYLKQELDKYLDLTTMLKYLRGTDFTEKHWREVSNLLEMEYKKPDTLQVKDLLFVASNIKKQIKLLQKICTAASNEAAIRNALNELELWFAGARLNITYYNDKAKRPIPIVKDFKDILSKIEERQWVVSSLSGGGDACAAWEARLRAVRASIRAAAHAQRRSVHMPYISVKEQHAGRRGEDGWCGR